MNHKVKCHREYYQKVISGEKTFEIRLNDRGYKTGDTITLQEWDFHSGYTGSQETFEVPYVLEVFPGLVYGYVAMSIIPARYGRVVD